jgi:drug/metabolite transporter (DMT)-like permease
MLVGALVLIPLVFLLERKADFSKKRVTDTIKYGALAGVILFLASVTQQLGIQLTGESGKAGFITSLYLVFVPLISFAFFKRKPSLFVLIALPFAVLGLYFLSFSDGFGTVSTGDLLLLVCSVIYAAHIITLGKSSLYVNPILFSCIQFFVGGVLGVASSGIFGTITVTGITSTLFPIFFSGIFSIAIAYTFQLLGQKNGNETVCALFCSMEALVAVIAECIMEAHLPSGKIIIGCALMLVAVVLSQIPSKSAQG